MCSTKSFSTSISDFFIRLLMVWASVTFSVNALADTQIVSPSAGSTLTGSAQTFTWTVDSEDIERVWMYVGTTEGGFDIANSGNISEYTELDVIGIPVDGSTIHTRFWYYSASKWSYVDSSYTAAELDIDVSAPTMDSPANSSELPGASVDFKWSDNNTLVNYWWLYLGTTKGGKDIYNSGRQTRTSITVDELPTDGSSVHARLWFRTAADGWKYIDSLYQSNSGSEPKPNDAPEIQSISLGCDLDTESVSIKMGDASEFFLLVDDESPLDLTYVVDMEKPDVASIAVDSEGMLLVSALTLGRTDLSVKVVDSEGLSDTIVIPIIVEL